MSKFKIKLHLQGLELEIEGSREDVPMLARNLGEQVAGLLQPLSNIAEGEMPGNGQIPRVVTATPVPPPPQRKKRSSRKRAGGPADGPADGATSYVIPLQHDAARFGMPKLSWNGTNKILWLLYIVREQTTVRELSARQVTETFEAYFREAGAIDYRNVSRDLKAAAERSREEKLVGKTDGSPMLWYLTQSGEAAAKALVADALTPPEAAPTLG